jgi:hypothetical protein
MKVSGYLNCDRMKREYEYLGCVTEQPVVDIACFNSIIISAIACMKV